MTQSKHASVLLLVRLLRRIPACIFLLSITINACQRTSAFAGNK